MIDGVKRRTWACTNEIHFGAPLPPPFAVLLRVKSTTPRVAHQFALEGHRFTPKELLENGMVNALGSSTKEVLEIARELADKNGVIAGSGVWGLIRASLLHS